MNSVVSFDESGNSGANLLDLEQPAFVLASVRLTEKHAESILGGPVDEVKFNRLRKSAHGRHKILEILNSELLLENDFVLSGVHKRFMVTTKIVDLLLEPMLYDAGIDLYERGANVAMANLLHFAMPVFIGQKATETIQAAFVEMVWHPSAASVDHFYKLLTSAKRRVKRSKFVEKLAMIIATKSVAKEMFNSWDASFLDPAIPTFAQHGSVWTKRLNNNFAIVHDSSKPIEQHQKILEAMMSTTDQPVEIGYDRRKRAFPIKAMGIEFRDSSTCKALQVADVLAGSTAYVLRTIIRATRDPFSTELMSTRALSARYLPIWPELKVTPEELGTIETGGIDPNDYVGEYVVNRLGEVPATGAARKKNG